MADAAVLEQAALWHERMQGTPDASLRGAFEAWLAADRAHACAYERIGAARDQAAALAQEPALLALRNETLARAALRQPRRRIGARPIAATILFLAAAPLAAWGFQHWLPSTPPPFEQTYRTAIGEQADVTLPDGTIVRLDTDSRMRVSFDGRQRRVSLNGQGWFDVTASNRPFLIRAAGRELSAGPGRFDIRTDPGMIRAFTDRGILSLAAGSSAIALGGGKLLTVRGDEASIQRLEDPASFTGWRNGQLLFDDVPLGTAVSELNRYRRQPLRIADANAAALHVSGSFQTAETPAFAEALAKGFPVRVTEDKDRGILIASRLPSDR